MNLPKRLNIHGTGTIEQPNRQIFTRTAVLTPIEEVMTSKYKHFLPKINIDKYFERLPRKLHLVDLHNEWNRKTDIKLTNFLRIEISGRS